MYLQQYAVNKETQCSIGAPVIAGGQRGKRFQRELTFFFQALSQFHILRHKFCVKIIISLLVLVLTIGFTLALNGKAIKLF